MGRKSEFFERATECERLRKLASHPMEQRLLKHLRDFWVSLAHECVAVSPQAPAAEVKIIEDIQWHLDIPARRLMH